MKAVEVLMACRCAGLEVRAEGDSLRVRRLTALSQLTPDLRQALLDRKPEILRLLRRDDRIDSLQEICPTCEELFVDLMGFGRCGRCVRSPSDPRAQLSDCDALDVTFAFSHHSPNATMRTR